MTVQKPTYGQAYARWLKDTLGITIPSNYPDYYESVTTRLRSQFQSSSFWVDFCTALREYNDEYKVQYGLRLINVLDPPLQTKSFDSFLLKTYRKNITDNRNWDNPPDNGWLTPENWFSRINDTVRTLVIVRYLDGVTFVTRKFKTFCEQHSTRHNAIFEARTDEGYYASHLYSTHEFELPLPERDTKLVHVEVEIHVTTQLQDVLRDLMHRYYEERRVSSKRETSQRTAEWHWDHTSDEFAANYLGNMLHFIEGKILDVRDRQRSKQL